MTSVNLDIVLRRLYRQQITIRKRTESQVSDTFGTTTESYTDYVVRGAIYPVTYEETYWATLGGLQVGDARGFLFECYEKDTGEPPHGEPEPTDLVYPAEGDILIAETGEIYEIIRLNKTKEWNYLVVEAWLRRRTA